MSRLAIAALAFLLAGHGCVAHDGTTTMGDERRLSDATTDDPSAPTPTDASAATRAGGLGPMLLALLAFLCVGTAMGGAVDGTTTMGDERRLSDATTDDPSAPTPTPSPTQANPDATDASAAAPRGASVFALAASLGLAARR